MKIIAYQFFPEEFLSFLVKRDGEYYIAIYNIYYHGGEEINLEKIDCGMYLRDFYQTMREKMIEDYLHLLSKRYAFDVFMILSDQVHENQYFMDESFRVA